MTILNVPERGVGFIRSMLLVSKSLTVKRQNLNGMRRNYRRRRMQGDIRPNTPPREGQQKKIKDEAAPLPPHKAKKQEEHNHRKQKGESQAQIGRKEEKSGREVLPQKSQEVGQCHQKEIDEPRDRMKEIVAKTATARSSRRRCFLSCIPRSRKPFKGVASRLLLGCNIGSLRHVTLCFTT